MAFPLIILALAVVSVFGTGVFNVVIAITIPLIPRCGRVVRASALAVREVPYVDAARALGFGHARIVLCHMVPNVLAPFLILLSAFVGQAILAEASLSYLGLGVQEPVAAWGLMLQGSAEDYATTAPWIAIFPGLAIVLHRAGRQPVRRCPARRDRSQAARPLTLQPGHLLALPVLEALDVGLVAQGDLHLVGALQQHVLAEGIDLEAVGLAVRARPRSASADRSRSPRPAARAG